MDFELKPEEQKTLQEVRDFIAAEASPELLEETFKLGYIYGGTEARKFIAKFAAQGWLTPNWPKEHGGLGASTVLTFAIRDEMARAGVPCIFVAAHMAGPTIFLFGSDEMKAKWLKPIALGEFEFALGYTEPQAGSDLSALNMSAKDMGDHFVVNGQKTFNTHSHVADYHWLAVRTDPEAKRHKGVSMLIVDLKSPGVTIRPLITMAGWQTNEVYYDDVKVPKENLVGEANRGFYYLMAALDFERMFPLGGYAKSFEDLVAYTKETEVLGRPLAKDPLVRQKLARVATEIEANKLLYYRLAHMLDKGQIPNYQSSMQKLFATEVGQNIARTGMEILGQYGPLKEGSKWAPLAGRFEFLYRTSVVETIYAGTSEVQRNIMAMRGLELPGK